MKSVLLIEFLVALNILAKVNSSTLSKSLTFKNLIHSENDYIIGYDVNWETGEIFFELEMKTTGYVGLGVSPDGGMQGADIFIAGVFPNGTAYGEDYHGTGYTAPSYDRQQDWNLLGAKENATFTRILVSRMLNTCDEDGDVPIIKGSNTLIWTVGDTDEVQFHTRRGNFQIDISQDVPVQCNPNSTPDPGDYTTLGPRDCPWFEPVKYVQIDCHNYYSCVAGEKQFLTCPEEDGLAFNRDWRMCDRIEFVRECHPTPNCRNEYKPDLENCKNFYYCEDTCRKPCELMECPRDLLFSVDFYGDGSGVVQCALPEKAVCAAAKNN